MSIQEQSTLMELYRSFVMTRRLRNELELVVVKND